MLYKCGHALVGSENNGTFFEAPGIFDQPLRLVFPSTFDFLKIPSSKNW